MGMRQSALSHWSVGRTSISRPDRIRIDSLSGLLSIEVKFRDGETVKLLERSRAPAADMSGLVEGDRQMALPAILGPEQRRPSRDVRLSIRPAHAEKILTGNKTVELRRRFASAVTPGTLALIYSTSPTSALTGSTKIKVVQCTDLPILWKTNRKGACLDKSDFEAYLAGLERGYGYYPGLCPARLNDRSDC
jgi:predicted transcriptional regulator